MNVMLLTDKLPLVPIENCAMKSYGDAAPVVSSSEASQRLPVVETVVVEVLPHPASAITHANMAAAAKSLFNDPENIPELCLFVWNTFKNTSGGPFRDGRRRRIFHAAVPRRITISLVQRKIFWAVFTLLGLLADLALPLWWALAATVPIVFAAWWIAYRSDWF